MTPTGTQQLLGVRVATMTQAQAVERCVTAVKRREHLEVGVVNAAKIVNMRKDPALRVAVRGCGLILADGQSVVWASKILRRPLPERIAGIDLFDDLLAAAAEQGIPVYLLGGEAWVVAAAGVEAQRRHPGLILAGMHDGYFAGGEEGEIADAIRRSGAGMLFLGMTSPKKERFCAEYGERTGVTLIHGVGGSFDILAGKTRRAPLLWQRAGLEWLYRTLQEPRRMMPRYVKTNTVFLALLLAELWAGLRLGDWRRMAVTADDGGRRVIVLPDTDAARKMALDARSATEC